MRMGNFLLPIKFNQWKIISCIINEKKIFAKIKAFKNKQNFYPQSTNTWGYLYME